MSGSLEARLGDLVAPESIDQWQGPSNLRCPRVAPTTESQFQAVLRLASAQNLRVLPMGRGSKLGWLQQPQRVDLVLSTLAYRGVTSYEPADGTVTARAGTPMGDLAAVVSEGGHHLSPAVPKADNATLGGVVASAQSGDDRLRYGALRDNLLGTRVALADGTTTKSGGQLVKNVTGYDLHRAICGSFGSLCVVLESSLRLHPLPEDRAIFKANFSTREEALVQAAAIRSAPVRPVTLLAHDLDRSSPNRNWTVLALLAGHPQVVGFEAQVLQSLCPSAALARGSGVDQIAKQVRDIEFAGTRWPMLSIESRPSTLPEVLVRVQREAQECGFALRTLCHPAIARTLFWPTPSNGAQGDDDSIDSAENTTAEALIQLDERLSQLPLVARWRDIPHGANALASPLRKNSPGSRNPIAAETMRELTRAFDPAGILAPSLFPE